MGRILHLWNLTTNQIDDGWHLDDVHPSDKVVNHHVVTMYTWTSPNCTYVRMYVCTYVRMYVCTYVRMYVCTYVRMYVCMYMDVYIYIYTYKCIHLCTYIYNYVYTHIIHA